MEIMSRYFNEMTKECFLKTLEISHKLHSHTTGENFDQKEFRKKKGKDRIPREIVLG